MIERENCFPLPAAAYPGTANPQDHKQLPAGLIQPSPKNGLSAGLDLSASPKTSFNVLSRLFTALPAVFSRRIIADGTVDADRSRRLAEILTSAFEGGRADSLQTQDDGIVSYGIHQATLKSGALEKVIAEYLRHSNSRTAALLSGFGAAITAKDPALAHDHVFLDAMHEAATEPAMLRAQETVFAQEYWLPSVGKATALGLSSPLALAVFYDTAIQGGLDHIIDRTTAELEGRDYSETAFLRSFLGERRQYLLDVAAKKRAAGQRVQATMLENSARNRVQLYENLLTAGDLQLESVRSPSSHGQPA
jgi:hypothetical protein